MKTAISIPDQLFQAAERYAQEQGLTRSALYARAVQHYLEACRYEGIVETLNKIYAEESPGLDPGMAAAQARVLSRERW